MDVIVWPISTKSDDGRGVAAKVSSQIAPLSTRSSAMIHPVVSDTFDLWDEWVANARFQFPDCPGWAESRKKSEIMGVRGATARNARLRLHS